MTDEHSCCSKGGEHVHNSTSSLAGSNKIREYWPLIVVVLFAAMLAFAGQRNMTAFMGYFLTLLSMFKFFDLRGFADGFQMYDIFAKRFRPYAYVYPFIELTLGLFFLAGTWPLLINIVTVAVMIVSAAGVFQNVLSGSKIKCACLGTALNVPLSTVSIVENGGMALMALLNIWRMLS